MKVIIYDSDCLMCSRFINLLIKLDEKEEIMFSNGHSDFVKDVIQFDSIDLSKTIVFYCNGMIFAKSKAINEIFKNISLFTKILSFAFFLIPNNIQDKIYDIISANRYIFGKKDNCQIYSESLRKRFLI